MAKKVEIDKAVLHKYFWGQATARHQLRIVQGELAAELGIHYVKMHRIIAEMIEQGRIKPFKKRNHQIGTYVIRDPADFPATELKKKK